MARSKQGTGIEVWDDLAASPAAPTTDTHGVAITEGTRNTHATYGMLKFTRTTGSGELTLTDIDVYVYDGVDWCRLVNSDGTDIITSITVDDVAAVLVKLEHVAAIAERMQVVIGTGMADGLSIDYVPILEDHRLGPAR